MILKQSHICLQMKLSKVLSPRLSVMSVSCRELAPLTSRAEWASLRAVVSGRVYLADGNQFFNRPGPRVAEALEIMAEMLHPQCFELGHRGSGWQLLNQEEA